MKINGLHYSMDHCVYSVMCIVFNTVYSVLFQCVMGHNTLYMVLHQKTLSFFRNWLKWWSTYM